MRVVQFGWLDTTIFIHVLFENDPHRDRCFEILKLIESGEGEGWIDLIVVHELTYVLPRCNPKFMSRYEVYTYINHFLLLDTIHNPEKDVLILSLHKWANTNLGFADAHLSILAQSSNMKVCSVNVKDFPQDTNSYQIS